MTINPFRWYRERREQKLRLAQYDRYRKAMRGEGTSGHLTPGERDRLFRDRRR